MAKMRIIKKVMTVLAIGLAALGCQAEYLPFIEEGKSWIVAEEGENRDKLEISSYRKIEVVGSMEISGKDFFVLKVTDGEYDDKGNWITHFSSVSSQRILLNEENGTISMAIPENNGYGEFTLFSLDMQPNEWDPVKPVKTTVEINGEQRTAVYVGSTQQRNRWIVEGIGASEDFWLLFPPMTYLFSYQTYMVECRKGDEVIFTQEDFQKLPIPGNNSVEMPSADRPLSKIYDLKGNSVSEMQQGEIYVKDGKKVMARE